jgi:hypothetical protein
VAEYPRLRATAGIGDIRFNSREEPAELLNGDEEKMLGLC